MTTEVCTCKVGIQFDLSAKLMIQKYGASAKTQMYADFRGILSFWGFRKAGSSFYVNPECTEADITFAIYDLSQLPWLAACLTYFDCFEMNSIHDKAYLLCAAEREAAKLR